MSDPTLITWTSQKSALTYPLEYSEDNDLYSGKNKWTDLASLSYQAHFGLKNKKIIQAIQKQMELFPMASPKHLFSLKERVSKELLVRSQLKNLAAVFYTLSGAEGIENALKMARQISGRTKVMALQNSYHGATMGALSITGDWRHQDHQLPREWTLRIPDPQNDPEGKELEKIIKKEGPENLVGFCLETITGGNGVFIPPQSWYQKVQSLCEKYQFFLILDEVVCGAHRTGPFLGLHHYPFLKPHFVVLAKGITGGHFPMGAILIDQKVAHYYQDHVLSCGLTNYGHPLGLAAIEAVLKITKSDKFQQKLSENIKTMQAYEKELRSLSGITQVRRIGMMMAIESSFQLQKEDFKKAGLTLGFQSDRIILAPALNYKNNALKKGLQILKNLLIQKGRDQ